MCVEFFLKPLVPHASDVEHELNMSLKKGPIQQLKELVVIQI